MKKLILATNDIIWLILHPKATIKGCQLLQSWKFHLKKFGLVAAEDLFSSFDFISSNKLETYFIIKIFAKNLEGSNYDRMRIVQWAFQVIGIPGTIEIFDKQPVFVTQDKSMFVVDDVVEKIKHIDFYEYEIKKVLGL